MLLNEFQLLSLYEEFLEAARLEKSIRDKAAEMIQLNQGGYLGQGLSVQMHEHKIEIHRDQQLVFQSNQDSTVRDDDLSKLEDIEKQLTGAIRDRKHQLEVQRQQEVARLEAMRLETQRKLAQTREIESQQRGHGHGFAR